jgi:hypothetical protein
LRRCARNTRVSLSPDLEDLAEEESDPKDQTNETSFPPGYGQPDDNTCINKELFGPGLSGIPTTAMILKDKPSWIVETANIWLVRRKWREFRREN